MNRTMLSVIALAVGAVLIIGLYNIYRPQINSTSHDVFDKVERKLDKTDMNTPKIGTPVENTIEYDYNGASVGYNDYYPGYKGAFHSKGRYGLQNHINWYDWNTNHMPSDWNIASFSAPKDKSENFKYGVNGTVQHVLIMPNPAYVHVTYVDNSGKNLGSYIANKREKTCYDTASDTLKSAMHKDTFNATVTKNSPNFPKGYHMVNGDSQTFGAYSSNSYVNVQVAK